MDKLLKNALDTLAERVDEYREADEAYSRASQMLAQRPMSPGAINKTNTERRLFNAAQERLLRAALVTASQWREV